MAFAASAGSNVALRRKVHGGGPRSAPGRTPRGRGRAAFTLLEVLLALVLTTLVGLAAARLLVALHTVEASSSLQTDRVRALDLASDLLGGELRRAGSAPYPPAAGAKPPPVRPALVLSLGSDARGDAIVVRYLDDRVQGTPVARDLRFDVAQDGRGAFQLYRTTPDGTRQPLVQGVQSVRVVGWVDAAGMHPRRSFAAGPWSPWQVLVELGAGDGATRRLVAPLPNRPPAEVVMSP